MTSSISVQFTNLVDVKLLLIPIAFLILRIWSFISDFAVFYLQIEFSIKIQYVLLFLGVSQAYISLSFSLL